MLRVTCLCSCYAALSSQLTKQHKDNSQLPPACSKMIFVQPFPFLISYVPLLLSFFSFCSFEEHVRRNDRAGILWTTIKIIYFNWDEVRSVTLPGGIGLLDVEQLQVTVGIVDHCTSCATTGRLAIVAVTVTTSLKIDQNQIPLSY